MAFNIWTFLFEVVNFLVLVYVLYRILYRPLSDAIDRRREANSRAQTDAEKARQEAAALKQNLSARLSAFDDERREWLRASRDQAEAERKAAIAEAERIIAKRREEAVAQLEREHAEAVQDLRAELVESAVALAERLLREASNSSLEQELAGRLVEQLEQIPASDCDRLRKELQGDAAAVVETATELNGEILERLKGAVEKAAGRAVSLSVLARPELVGGVRLSLGGHVWDASFKGALGDAAFEPEGRAAP